MQNFTQVIWEFFSFSDPNIRYVAAGSMLLAASSAVVGCFTFLRKRALIGDAVSHAVLPGICLAFFLTESKNPLVLLVGAFATSWLSLTAIDVIVARTRIKQDTAIGVVLSVFFGVGIVFLTMIQQRQTASQAGLDKFLFGKAASLVASDVMIFGAVAVVLITVSFLLFKEFMVVSFDEHFAHTLGFPVRWIELVLTTLTVLAVVIGIQAVGVVLMAAMLITPAVAARQWTNNLRLMIVIAASIGAFSGLFGAFISYTAPAMPTGPWIVVVVSLLAIFSLLFSPHRGVIARVYRQRRYAHRVCDENVVKALYQLGETISDFTRWYSLAELVEHRALPPREYIAGLQRLHHQGYVLREGNLWKLTAEGLVRGRRIARLHRLWEVYLTEHVRIAPDHVHDDAESIEHVLTPELEKELEQFLHNPKFDPHSKKIPEP